MNAIGIALVWCIVQVTLIGLVAASLYVPVRRLRPAAAAPVMLTGLAMVVILSLLALSPWPRWIHSNSPLLSGEGQGVRAVDSAVQVVRNEPIFSELPTVSLPLSALPLADVPSAAKPTDHKYDTSTSPNSTSPSLATLWHALVDELSNPTSTASASTWRWPAIVAVLLVATMLCGLGWLVLGVMAVRWERLRSRPVLDGKLLELIDVLRAELSCLRPIEVRQSDNLVTAATIGWRRPAVLLPGDWTSWTSDQRRAVLAHEIAHARSQDFLAVLFGQLALVLHFYHPLVHWLMGRLRLEQELAADAAAASVSGGQRQYLMTIAELALRQQERPLLWPARSFLPTRTTFLRRIAMLRDSKLHVGRLSPAMRVATVGTVLLCGLLVAGLRGPSVLVQALAADADKPAADDSIDMTYMRDKASMILVVRPATIAGRPELAALAKRLEQPLNVLPKGSRLTDIRQITVIGPEAYLPLRLREVVAIQFIKPTAAEDFVRQLGQFSVKQRDGKKLCVSSASGFMAMQYDDNTVVTAASEQALDAYLAGKPGVLPKWLPAKAWESLHGDHFVLAADSAMMAREMKPLMAHSPGVIHAALTPIVSVCEDTTWQGVGARVGNDLSVHVLAGAKDADSAAKVRDTAVAFKTLLQVAAKSARTQAEAHQGSGPVAPREWFDLADRLLDNAKLQQDGNDVRVDASVEMDAARLSGLVKAIDTAANARLAAQDPSTKQGMMALVEDFFQHNFRDVTSRETIEWGDVTKTVDGNFSIRYKYRAKIWDKETKIINQVFTFDKQGKYVSVKDVMAAPGTKEGMMDRVEDFFKHNFRDVTSRKTIEWGEVTKLPNGNASIRYKYVAKIWDKETKIISQVFTFDSKGEYVSVKDVEGFPAAAPADAGASLGGKAGATVGEAVKAASGTANGEAAAVLRQTQNNMKQLALAMHNYAHAHRRFPPAVLYGPDGKTQYSWRVALLPYMEGQDIYKQYHFDEPWDGPNNRKLLEKMPAVFRCPAEPAESKNSSYFALVGPGAIFDTQPRKKVPDGQAGPGAMGGTAGAGGMAMGAPAAMPGTGAMPASGGTVPAWWPEDAPSGTGFMEITDGTSNTILLVEAKRNIPWTKPDDIPYDPDKPLPKLGGYFVYTTKVRNLNFEGGFFAAMADGSVHFLSSTAHEKVLRLLIAKADRQPVSVEDAKARAQAPKPPATPAGGKYTASAYLRVALEKPFIAPSEAYKRTQQQLLLSRVVLQAALRNPELANLAPVQRAAEAGDAVNWLMNQLRVEFVPSKGEVMRVSLSSEDPKEAATLVNIVVDTYLKEVVNAERDLKQRRLDELDGFYTAREKELKQLAEQSRTSDKEATSPNSTPDIAKKLADIKKSDPIFRGIAKEREKLKASLQLAPRVTLLQKAEVPKTPSRD